MLIHDHADDVHLDNVSASALADHGDADEGEHRLPVLYACAGDGAHARVPIPRVYGDDHAVLLDAAHTPHTINTAATMN